MDMKKLTRLLKSKSGMTYVEMLVALALLALIVITFTPMLLVAYDNTYKAGSITQGTYDSRVSLEESLAVRYNDQPKGVNLLFEDATSSLTVRLKRIFTYINDKIDRKKYAGLETLYGMTKPSVSIISGDTVYDDSATQIVKLQFVNFDMDKDGDGTVESSEFTFKKTQPGVTEKNAAGIVITAPLKDDTSDPYRFNADTQVTIGEFDSDNGTLTITLTKVDVTYSPLKITVGFYKDEDDTKLTFLTEYLTIKPASIMLVGKCVNVNNNYYTTAGLVDGSVKVEARTMTGAGVTSAVFNAVRWVGASTDQNFSAGYYAMCGNNGIIKRLWSITENEAAANPELYNAGMYEAEQMSQTKKAYKYVWAGDYAEIYTYGDYSSNIKGNNSATNDRHFAFGDKANTFTKYTGFKNGKSGVEACQQISYNVADGTGLSSLTKSGEYFATVIAGGSTANGGLRKGWNINWEDFDGWSFKAGNNEGGLNGYYSSDTWASYVKSTTNASSGSGFDQPAIFFGSVGGVRDSESGGKAYIGPENEIDRVYLMTENYGGTTTRYAGNYYYKWVDFTKSSSPQQFDLSEEFKKGKKSNYFTYDTAASFTEIPSQYAYSSAKTTAQNQQTVLQFIYDYLTVEKSTVPAYVSTFTGVSGTSADGEIAYLRLKAYTNANSLESLRYDGTSDAEKTAQEIENTAGAASNSIMNSVKINLWDLYYIPSAANYTESNNVNVHSGNSMVYTGTTAASAMVYSTVPGSVSQTSHGSTTSGLYRVYEIIGTDNGGTTFSDNYEKGYTINQFADTDKHHNSSNSGTYSSVYSSARNSTTAFTLGYSSNHLLTLGSPAAITKTMTGTVNSYLDFPAEFTSYVNFSGDSGLTIQAGYRVCGYATNDSITVAGCQCASGNGAHSFGSKPATLGSDFFYSTAMWKNVNEDLRTFDNNGNFTYKRGYYLEAASQAAYDDNHDRYSGIVFNYPTCVAAFTGLRVVNNSNVDTNIVNSGVLSTIFDGDIIGNGIYEEKPTGNTSLRFTSSCVYMSGTVGTQNAYTIIFGGTDGKLRVINKYYQTLGSVTLGTGDSNVQYAAFKHGGTYKTTDQIFTDIKDIDCSGECVVAVGDDKMGNSTYAMVYDLSASDGEWKCITVSSTVNATLYDVECVGGVYYAVGTVGTRGVLFYTDNPLTGNWTCVERDVSNAYLQPLYSLASSIG